MNFNTELLDPIEERFCNNMVFMVNCSPADAARTAGIETDYELYASRLLNRPDIKNRIIQLSELKEDLDLVQSTPILVQLARIAFFDPSELIEMSKNPDTHKLSRFAKAAIAGIDITRTYTNDELEHLLIDVRCKYNLSNRIQAIKLIGEHIGCFQQPNVAVAALKTCGIHLAKVNGRWTVVEDENFDEETIET